MSALIVRIPDEKHARLKLLAKTRQVSVNKLVDEMATIMLAEFDAETRFLLRATRGRNQRSRGIALLAKAAGKRSPPLRQKRGNP
jgi:HicB family